MNQEFSIERIASFTPQTAAAIRNLAQQLGDRYQELTDDDIREILSSPMHNLFVAVTNDGQIVGMLLVLVYRIPYLRKAYFEDLIVDPAYRGKGLGRLLMTHGLDYATSRRVAYADLTSMPERTTSNALYEKLGFEKRGTNIYRKTFRYDQEK